MADPISFGQYDVYIGGRLMANTFTPPAGSVTNTSIAALAGIEPTKLTPYVPLGYAQAPGTAIVAATLDLHTIKGASGAVAAIDAVITGAIATGADRTVTIDLQKGNTSTAFATILSATIGFTNVSVLRTVSAGTIAAGGLTLADNDILRLTVAVAGAAGNQAQGLLVSLKIYETAV